MSDQLANAFRATDALACFTSRLCYDDLPEEVTERLRALLVDFFRVGAAGTRTPWVQKLREAFSGISGSGTASVLYSATRLDPVRAAYMNGVIAGSLEWDDTHVGAMLHPGIVVWPAVLAIGERVGAPGRDLMAAAAAGYEVMIRIGLGVQPGHFRRGFQSTATCGVFGAAAAAAKLLGLGPQGIRDALGIAGSYAGGVTQFFVSGSEVKRLHGGKASAAGVEAALFAEAGLAGPPDILEGSQGFARAMAAALAADGIQEGLGERYHILRLQMKPHAVSARVLAAVEAAEDLVKEGVRVADITAVEIGVPAVIVGRLTRNDPGDLQQAQMSAPFAVAMTLALAGEREKPLVLSADDFEASFGRPEIRDLSRRITCVLDPEIERATTTEYVPARVNARLRDGRIVESKVFQPRGCPERPMSSAELSARFRSVTEGRLPREDLAAWLKTVDRLGEIASARNLMTLRLEAAPNAYGPPIS